MGDGFLRGCGKADLGMNPAMSDEVAQHHVPQVCGSGCSAWRVQMTSDVYGPFTGWSHAQAQGASKAGRNETRRLPVSNWRMSMPVEWWFEAIVPIWQMADLFPTTAPTERSKRAGSCLTWTAENLHREQITELKLSYSAQSHGKTVGDREKCVFSIKFMPSFRGGRGEKRGKHRKASGYRHLPPILVRIGSNDSSCACESATESLPPCARHLGDLISGRIDTIVCLILVDPGVPVEATLARDLLHLRLSLRVLLAAFGV